jgi:hypothetical protein
MKIGDKIEIRNVGGEAWAKAQVVDVNKDGTIKAKVDQDGHEFHGKTLTFDETHYRRIEGKQ